jgi:hypothetical protein
LSAFESSRFATRRFPLPATPFGRPVKESLHFPAQPVQGDFQEPINDFANENFYQ